MKILELRELLGKESDFDEIPLWESAKENKCTLSEEELKDTMAMLKESKDEEFEDVWV